MDDYGMIDMLEIVQELWRHEVMLLLLDQLKIHIKEDICLYDGLMIVVMLLLDLNLNEKFLHEI
jgi:hypothetical protein